MKDFLHLFHEELKAIYSVEKELKELLPEIIQAARNSKLKEIFEAMLNEIPHQIERLENIGHLITIDFSHAESESMKGMVKECRKIMGMNYLDQVLDAALINLVQKIKHYEIATYGALKSFAHYLKLKDVEALLNESSKEEKLADKHLTDLALGSLFGGGINSEASRRRSA